jgi:exonuclease III
MAGQNFKIVSQNIASSQKTDFILDILRSDSPDLLLLQEVTLTTAQLLAAVTNLGYSCESNIDLENPTSPGTAAVWKSNLPVTEVNNLQTCRLQSLRVGLQTFLNIYAPSGSANRRERNLLFTRDMFPHLLQHQASHLPVLVGDRN